MLMSVLFHIMSFLLKKFRIYLLVYCWLSFKIVNKYCHVLMDVQIDFHAIPTTCAAMHWWRSRLFFMFDIYKALYKILVKTLWNGKQWHTNSRWLPLHAEESTYNWSLLILVWHILFNHLYMYRVEKKSPLHYFYIPWWQLSEMYNEHIKVFLRLFNFH